MVDPINKQKFPSGEVRTFKPDGENVWRLTQHEKPAGSDYGANLIGTAMEDMPAPKEALNEQSGG
jgi:hypothetical protein